MPKYPLLFISLLLWQSAARAQQDSGPFGLQCEHLVNPLGLDSKNPRLSWQNTASQQMAFQVYVNSDSAALARDIPTGYHSQKINSAAQQMVYQGSPLQPFTRYFWKVKVWDGRSRERSSSIASFEMGMMESRNWKGAWISDTRDINLKPAPFFQKRFMLSKPVRTARVYIAAAGLYELYFNGKKMGDHLLDPMYTRYDRRLLYVTYDITRDLQAGNNDLGVLLGNGWYNLQSTAVWYFDKAPWRGRPAFCLDLRITYQDGTVETLSTDNSWQYILTPVQFNSIYTGEHYDARVADTTRKPVIYRSAPAPNILAQSLYPIRAVDTIPAVSMQVFSDTDFVFDLGRNIAGVSRITLSGPAGTIIRLKHGERLYKNGHVDISNIDVHYRPTDDSDPFQTDIDILQGLGRETFQPHFNYKGFQYVELTSSSPLHIDKESLTGLFMHSDVPVAGTIHASNPLLNKIWEAANHSYLSNLYGYPTDCPQREKNGWTGDAQINVETGLYNFDALTIYEKWMADHRDEQQPNGVLPSIVPSSGWGYEWGNGPDWTSTIAIIPWNLYLFYGDSQCLADCYGPLRRYVDHIQGLFPSGLCSWGLGDWIPVKSKCPVELTSTAYYYTDVCILRQAAKILNHPEDYKKYAALAETIKMAFNKKYLDTKTGIYADGTQTEMAVPLFWHLVPDALIATVAANLAKRVEADGNQLDVGLLGTKAILNALSENGYADVAYRLASNDREPSWGWWIKNGATTLYENWPIDAGSDISMNHIMFGEISAWFYKALGGIKPDPQAPGFKNILLQPKFVEGLDSFSCAHLGPYGWIRSSWHHEGKQLIYTVTIPPNATASLLLQGKKDRYKKSLSAGTYTFHLE